MDIRGSVAGAFSGILYSNLIHEVQDDARFSLLRNVWTARRDQFPAKRSRLLICAKCFLHLLRRTDARAC